MDAQEEARSRKLEAGRAKFAYFRQRKAKGNITQLQKNTAKTKGSALHTHDVPKEEHPVAARDAGKGIEGQVEDQPEAYLPESTTEAQDSNDLSSWEPLDDHATEKDGINSAVEYSEADAQMCQVSIAELESRLLQKQESVERLTVQMNELQDQLTQHDSMQLQEMTVQEQHEIIRRLTICLQQVKKDRDELQEEASHVAGQIHDLQIQLHQDCLRVQNAHLEILRKKANDLEVQLESFQKNTKDKENLLSQMEEDMKDSVQELHKSIDEKEQFIKSLQDKLTSERSVLSILQHTLSLRDSEITELRKEIALYKVEEQQHIEELKISHEKEICRQLDNLRNELEKCHRREIAEAKRVYEEEIILKYKNELEQLKKELSAWNSEENIQNLNSIIIDLNIRLRESEINKENLRRKLENQWEDFQKEKSELETKYKDLIEGLKYQLSYAEEQVKEAKQYKEEQQFLSEEIKKLNFYSQELNEKHIYEAERNIDVRQKCDREIISNKKLLELRENQILSEMSELQGVDLEEMWDRAHQSECRHEPIHGELEFQHDSSRDQLEETKNLEIMKDNGSSKEENLSGEPLSELGLFSGDEAILAKYLISTETPEDSYVSSSLEGHAIEEGRYSAYGLDSSVLLEPSRGFLSSPLNSSLDGRTCLSGLDQDIFVEADMRAENFVSDESDGSLQQNKIGDHGGIEDAEMLCLAERHLKPAEQLPQKSALEVPYQDTQEAVRSWEKAMSELSHMHAKERARRKNMEEEHEAQISCEKELLQEMEKEKELKNKRMLLVKQQGEDRGQPSLTQVSNPFTWLEMVKDLQEERDMLMMQLRTQEQLVRDVQEQRTDSDSMISEVQALFGRQLVALQSQRDQMQSQLNAQKAKNQRIAELFSQKTVSEETLLKEQELLKAEINNKDQNVTLLLKEKIALRERLSNVEEDLVKAEKALTENASIIEDLEKNIHELNAKMKNIEEMHKCERLSYEDRLNLSNQEIIKLTAEIKEKKTEYLEEKSQLTEEIAQLKKAHLDLEARLQESYQAAQEAQSKMEKHYKDKTDRMETQCLSELTEVSLTQKREIKELNAEKEDKVEEQQKFEEKRKEEIAILKKVHEREHDREICELAAKHSEEMEKLRAELKEEQRHLLDELWQQMAATHRAEHEQAQLQSKTLHSLELEALRLTLNNMHTSQLELTQSNLRKEKETALMELREMLNDKRAQEVAILQSRHQLEWEKIKEQCLKEKEDLEFKYQQELVDQRKKIELEMEETHIQALETLKRDWELESDRRLKNMCEELSEKHQTEMIAVQKSLEMDLEKVRAELGLLSVENVQSKMKCIELERQHLLAITELQEQLQAEHNQLIEDIKMKSQEKEQDLQKELDQLQVKHEQLKAQSREEIRQLWSQLDSTRANQQELSGGVTRMQARGPELKEQLLAQASQVKETECLEQEFEQQHQQRNREHEAELEQLRLYFENKLIVAEENCEELALLHQSPQELTDCSLSKLEISQDQAGDTSSSVTVFEENAEKGRSVALCQLNQQLEKQEEKLAYLQLQLMEQEKHDFDSLRNSLALQYKEDLMKMKMDLSDKYVTEIEAMKRRHCLELEQLRAQLSEERSKEITKLCVQSAQDVACQVEMEVAEQVSVLEEEHKAKLVLSNSEKQYIAELSEEIRHLKEEIRKQKYFFEQNEKHLKEETEKVKCKIAEDHKKELREEIQKIENMYKEKEKKWQCESEAQRILAEEKLSLLHIELQTRAESEKQNLKNQFELHEAEMIQLQHHQAAKILELEKLVKEQQNNLQQLEDSLTSSQAMQKAPQEFEADLEAAKVLMAKEIEKVTLHLQEECALKLLEAQNKFMEEHKAMTQKFTAEQEILLQKLKKKHVDELEVQSQQLQERHKQHILSLTADLQAKHQAEIETLKSTLESKQQIQVESCVAELQTKHQAQIDELEVKHLSNLDSLESSYLSEIQMLRDKHSQALEKLYLQHREQLQEQDKMHQAQLLQEIEKLQFKYAEELQLSQNNLKIELATVNIEKLNTMALEAEEVHKDDLNVALQNQRQLLEKEKHLALDLLRDKVLQMEEKHRKALQELQSLHEADIRKHKEEYSRELEEELGKLKAQHEREQELYVSASASEVESVRTSLLAQFEEVKLKQQLQFQEEIELLKCQSEVLLEQQIAQLKDEFEAEKKASLRDKEQVFIQEREKAQALHQKEQEMLSAQLEEKAAIIIQLEKKVASLKHEIGETNSELETLIQWRDRENKEGGNLLALLRSDIEQSKEEREKLHESYQHVLKLLMEVVNATIVIEDLICSKIGLCLDDSLASGHSKETQSFMEGIGLMQYFKAKENHQLEKASLFSVEELLDETLTEHNQLSPGTDEVSELSQYLCKSVFAKPELACESEETILKICHRLRTAVERLLELVTESTQQLEKMHENHAQFEEEFSRRNRETAHVVSQHQELMECLSEESEAKNHLALELHKAEGIIEGYVAEKAALEEALSLKEESERRLVVELESMRERFQELTQEQAILGLLKEVEFLSKEKIELQCQAEQDHSNLRSQMRVLEVELEEQLCSNQDLATKLLEVSELKQQIEVLEKQLKKQRQFMDEQAIEREHERDDFQQEIQKLEEQLKLSAKSQTSGQSREHRVEYLQEEIKEKMDDYNKLLLEKEQKHQEIAARDKEIEKLVGQIQELKLSGAEVSKTVHSLEQQLQKMKKVETELKRDKEALQQQQYNNLIQISALQSKLDEVRHRVPVDGSSAPVLKEQLQAEQKALQAKEREVASLLDQVEQYKDNLSKKDEEILQLNVQLEIQKNFSSSNIIQLQAENAHLQEDLTKLHAKQSQYLGISDSSALSFPQALLEEKNQEIDHLNEQIKRLEHELQNKVAEDQKPEIEKLRSLIEHLRLDQERLRKDKDEEVEQLHGVIEKLQKELAQLGPVCHEDSENQARFYEVAVERSVENLQNELKRGLVACEGDADQNRRNASVLSKVRELQEELELVSASKEALQQQLEKKELQLKTEVEILEKKCQQLRESSEQSVAELTSLRIQHQALQEKYSICQTCLSQREAETKMTISRVQELEDKEKDEVLFDLTIHNKNPKTQSQENILLQELDMIHSSEGDQDLKKHCQQMLEIHQTPDSPKHNLNIDKETPKDYQNLIASVSSWGSPEIMRKQDISMEIPPVLYLTPFSEAENTNFQIMHTSSSLQEDNSISLGCPNLDEKGSGNAAVGVDRKSPAFSESTYSAADDKDMEKLFLMREGDNLPLAPSDLQDDERSGASAMSDGCGSNTSSNLAANLKQELQTLDHLDANVMAYLRYRGMIPDIMESLKEEELLSPHMKTVLKMVYEESHKILALSEHPFGFRGLKSVPQTQVTMEGWQKEGSSLLDAIQSLKVYLSKVADRGDKETSDVVADWRGELLQAVQSVFEKERNVLQIDLKSHFSNPTSGDASSLGEKLEYIMKQQEEQRQMVLEHLFSSDRNSLLSEIQDLRAQLHMTHLQNQEKLQQLQETLTKAEHHGNKQEHQLRRKVELLEYKLQQEKSIVSDLHSTLSEEQKRSSETCDLLNQEKASLKSELSGSKQENERLQKSLEELQREINHLRVEMEKKEKDLVAALDNLQAEQLKGSELRGWFEEHHRLQRKAEDEKTKAIEELQAALDVQLMQNCQLVMSLDHEKTVTGNLRKELQIEHSRCEALLSQEQNKLRELQKNLDAEKNRSLELLDSLNHERVLTEQLSVRVKEGTSCQHRESLLEKAFIQELQAQLEVERAQTMELAAVIEKMDQKAILSKRHLEAEVQMMCCEETQKEREVSDKLRATLESLQAQKQEVTRSLEAQREREVKLKADWEQLQLLSKLLKEQDKNRKEEREREQKQQQQTELQKQKDWQKNQERLQNLERQHQRDEQRIKELQEILKERERNPPVPNCQEELLCTSSKDGSATLPVTKETEKTHLQQQQQQLENIRQQLFFVAVHLNEFIYKTLDKTVNDWSVSNDEAVASLLKTLREIKSDLSLPTSQMRSTADANAVQELEREAWQRERNMLQNMLKQAEFQLAKANAEIENKPVAETSSPKLQRLYRKYIRAESFRKALVYQKKYLLLLLGGFQNCEQATLSLIARMGIYPSHADLQPSGSHSQPFTKFRCAVRAIIAISRLKFLVKKWNKVRRKNTPSESISHSIGGNTASGARTEVLNEQQPPAVPVSSPPTQDRDTGLCHRTRCAPRFMRLSPRFSSCSHNRLHLFPSSAPDKSLMPPQDPEQSLTEYIHRLEVIQQRLGGVQPGQVLGSPQRNLKE